MAVCQYLSGDVGFGAVCACHLGLRINHHVVVQVSFHVSQVQASSQHLHSILPLMDPRFPWVSNSKEIAYRGHWIANNQGWNPFPWVAYSHGWNQVSQHDPCHANVTTQQSLPSFAADAHHASPNTSMRSQNSPSDSCTGDPTGRAQTAADGVGVPGSSESCQANAKSPKCWTPEQKSASKAAKAQLPRGLRTPRRPGEGCLTAVATQAWVQRAT